MNPPKDLSRTERAVWIAFPRGEWVDLREGKAGADDPEQAGAWEARRTVRAEIIKSLLLSALDPSTGATAALKLKGARISGCLSLAGSRVNSVIHFAGCRFDEPLEFTGATTRTISLASCDLDGFNGRLLRVNGDLILESSHIHGCVMLRHSSISGSIHLSGCQLLYPGKIALSGGGMTIEGGLFGRQGLVVEGGVRLIGARIMGGVFFEGARLQNPVGIALCLDQVTAPIILCNDEFASVGEIQLRDASVRGLVDFNDATLSSNSAALQCYGMHSGGIRLTPKSINGLVDLELAQIRMLQDKIAVWPDQVRLDGLTYEHLRAVQGRDDVTARLAWLQRGGGLYRPQPYEQLAAFYRRIGHDHDARRVLLAKERARRASLRPFAKSWAYLLDVTVGHGYRPWLAGIWLVVLLGIGTIVFAINQPRPLYAGHALHFNSFVYSLDLLAPVSPFGLRNTYSPSSSTQWLAYVLIIAGWVLATAVIAGISRVLRRNLFLRNYDGTTLTSIRAAHARVRRRFTSTHQMGRLRLLPVVHFADCSARSALGNGELIALRSRRSSSDRHCVQRPVRSCRIRHGIP